MKLQDRNLSSRMKGEDVKLLHGELLQLGFAVPLEEVEEKFFGKATRKAILEFQKQHSLPTSGVVDEHTATMIKTAVEKMESRQVVTTRRAVGQLLDQDTDAPLAGYTVRAFDLDAKPEPKDVGYDITNERGLFVVVYSISSKPSLEREDEASEVRLRLHIIDPRGEEIHQAELVVKAEQEEVMQLRVPVRPIPVPPSPSLTELVDKLEIQVPEGLLTKLADQGIHTLADIRKAGGVSHLKDLPAAADDPVASTLEAHANLSTLSSDIQLNAALIENEYTKLSDIAKAPRTDFVGLSHEEVGDVKAAQLHVQAKAQANILNNIIAGYRVNKTNGFPTPFTLTSVKSNSHPVKLFPAQCGCKDCESATSPLAYLVDLLDYSLTHLKVSENGEETVTPITLDFLSENFHQLFGDLPASCDELGNKITQVRICVEVLRNFLGSRPLAVANVENAFLKEEKEYRIRAYTTILNQLGTSYEELRLARTLDAQTRSALAERLGINVNHLPDLLLDPEALSADLLPLSENVLEQLFGLVDTNRDPLSEGAKIGDGDEQITRWNLSQVAWNQNTDLDGMIFLTIKKSEPNVFRVLLFRDEKRTQVVASGECNTSEDQIFLVEENSSGLSGVMEIDFTAESDTISISAVPQILCWKQERLRALWREQDWPLDSYTDGTDGQLPIIDPNVIGKNDLRYLEVGTAAYDLLQERRNKIDAFLADLRANRVANDLDDILRQVLGEPLPDLETLVVNLISGIDIDQTKNDIENLNLSIESFSRLIEIKGKDDADDPVEDEEWEEVYAILTQAYKLTQFPAWIAEEQAEGLILGSKQFWFSIQEPEVISNWLASVEARQAWQQALRARSQSPHIDPDVIGIGYLKRPLSGGAANLWEDRHDWITTNLNEVNSARVAHVNALDGFNEIVQRSLEVPASELEELAELRSQGTEISGALNQLSLTAAAYECLLRKKELLENGEALLDTEWADVYSILVEVRKRRKFAEWREEERELGITIGPDHFKLPAAPPLQFPPPEATPLPKWRATDAARRNWMDTLQTRIDQEHATMVGVDEMVSVSEEETLPLLRNALIMATDNDASDLETNANQISKRLLIDTKVDGCLLTTRVDHAIATIHLLIWGIRTGQLNFEFPDLLLDDDYFEEAWTWLGSYNAWRAAMMVFLYPENILLPNLRRHQTPAFEQLVTELRGNRRITAKDACEAAKSFSSYFRDISALSMEASCQTRTRIFIGDKCREIAAEYRSLIHIFARGGDTNTVYWSSYDPEGDSGYSQTFWRAVPALNMVNVINLIGAVPYEISPEKRYIYLFAVTREGEKQCLVYARYNLDRHPDAAWDNEVTELHPPIDASSFSVVVEQRADEQEPPRFAFHFEGNEVSVSRMDSAGGNLDETEHRLLNAESNLKKVCSLIDLSPRAAHFLFLETTVGELKAGWFDYETTDDPIGVLGWIWISSGNWIGSIQYPDAEPWLIYVYFEDADGIGYGKIGIPEIAANNVPRFPGPVELKHIAIHIGEDPTLNGMRIAYETGGRYLSVFTSQDEGELEESFHTQVAPEVISIFDITDEVSEFMTTVRRYKIQDTFMSNQQSSASIKTYLEEAYYYVPMYLGMQLVQRGDYEAALKWFRTVYDYNLPEGDRKISYFLVLDEPDDSGFVTDYERFENWLLDPLNPHSIAGTRPNTYTRFTLLSIVNCLLKYADAEFARDSTTSLQLARTLYTRALELLDTAELRQYLDDCVNIIGSLEIEVGHEIEAEAPDLLPVFGDIIEEIMIIQNREDMSAVIEELKKALAENAPWRIRLVNSQAIVSEVKHSEHIPPKIKTVLSSDSKMMSVSQAALFTVPGISDITEKVSVLAGENFLQAVSIVTGASRNSLESEKITLPWLRQRMTVGTTSLDLYPIPRIGLDDIPLREDYRLLADFSPVDRSNIPLLVKITKAAPLEAVQIVRRIHTYVPNPSYTFCIPANPIIRSLRLHAELNLHKLRTCRNIAGLKRQVESYSISAYTEALISFPALGGGFVLPPAVRYQPTPYRYDVLIDRAKQFVGVAQQIEAAFLFTLEKRDAEYYNLLKARQEVQLTRAGVRLQDLRIQVAEDGIELAQLQQDRAQFQADHYQKLLDNGLIKLEKYALNSMGGQGFYAILFEEALAGGSEITGGLVGGIPIIGSLFGASRSRRIQRLLTLASYERRKQEWDFLLRLANQDSRIGAQQVNIATDYLLVVGQERNISEMQAEHAGEVVDFLSNKFTNVELYDWMSGVLEGVFGFFLQQATALAKLAESQLAFERQESPPPFIQADYLEAPVSTGLMDSTDANAADRRGLTGSARLLQDIYQLDQYAFETNRRKLQITKTISLAQLSPAEFQSFRETGVMTFATPMQLFDQDFPGHYLRLISRVRTSVIALIPPVAGIHATLSTSGISRVVISRNGLFQQVTVTRTPQSTSLSSPRDATGLFELTSQPEEMLFPFEGMGVDTMWQLSMPKAANPFDYSSVADVLLTLDYTALESLDYRQQLMQQLSNRISAERPFGFRNEFADQWYDFNNPNLTDTPMAVSFETRQEDFPPNIDNLKIQHVVLYFVRANRADFEVPVTHLRFTEEGSTSAIGGGATSIDGVISTRRGNASSWTPMIGKSPVGVWELSLPDTSEMKRRFNDEEIEDILFVVTYSGVSPSWPK